MQLKPLDVMIKLKKIDIMDYRSLLILVSVMSSATYLQDNSFDGVPISIAFVLAFWLPIKVLKTRNLLVGSIYGLYCLAMTYHDVWVVMIIPLAIFILVVGIRMLNSNSFKT